MVLVLLSWPLTGIPNHWRWTDGECVNKGFTLSERPPFANCAVWLSATSFGFSVFLTHLISQIFALFRLKVTQQ